MQEPHTFEFFACAQQHVRRAAKEQSADIARLIMMAMTDECCLYFCGDSHGLEIFSKRKPNIIVEFYII